MTNRQTVIAPKIKTNNIAFLILICALCGCVPAFVGTTAVVGSSIVDERSIGEQIDDNVILVKLKKKYSAANVTQIFERVSVTVIEGRVLLTGSVNAGDISLEASNLAWTVPGVKEVINELIISEKDWSDRTKDMYIASVIRSKLLLTADLYSVNYAISVNEQVVYVIGLAQDKLELNKCLDIISGVKGVKRVVSHITLKDDIRRKNKIM